MIQLQKPKWVYLRGKLRPWEEAVLHVSTEAVTRGLNVFEGLKGYWDSNSESFGIVSLRKHFTRLERSARLLYIPCLVEFDEFEEACHSLVRSLLTKERDMWIRATLYVVEGHWGEGTVADLVLTAYHQDKIPPKPIAIGVSTWQRSSDVSLPPRIKTSTNYQVARLARIEGRGRGFSEMVLLNQWGRVAEATGACILMVKDGKVITTPAYEGALESITVEIVKSLCGTIGVDFIRRPIDRTELYLAKELSLAGTLAELTPVTQVDEFLLPGESPILDAVRKKFWDAVRQVEPHPAADLSIAEY
jgi:branched-chain amino acid aminotransferase